MVTVVPAGVLGQQRECVDLLVLPVAILRVAGQQRADDLRVDPDRGCHDHLQAQHAVHPAELVGLLGGHHARCAGPQHLAEESVVRLERSPGEWRRYTVPRARVQPAVVLEDVERGGTIDELSRGSRHRLEDAVGVGRGRTRDALRGSVQRLGRTSSLAGRALSLSSSTACIRAPTALRAAMMATTKSAAANSGPTSPPSEHAGGCRARSPSRRAARPI